MTAAIPLNFGERVRGLLAATFIPRDQARTLRRQIEDAAQELIDLLDELDAPGQDLEPDDEGLLTGTGHDVRSFAGWRSPSFDPTSADMEPTLGWPEGMSQEDLRRGSRIGDWYCPDGEAEPSLGSVHSCARAEFYGQISWADGGRDDQEDEHDGREPDDADLEEDYRQLPTPSVWMAVKARPGAMPLPGGYEPIGF